MIRPRRLFGMALLVLSLPLSAQQTAFRFEGVAKPIDGGQPLYREQHEISGHCDNGYWQPVEHRVEYRRSDSGEGMASKTLTYPYSLFRPAVAFRQPDFNETLQVDATGSALSIRWSRDGEPPGNWTVEATDNLVLDAGFDHFVRAHWNRLTAGGEVPFEFLAPTRGEAYGFVVEPAPEPVTGADHSFRIRPTGLIMRLAVDPIRLGYSADGFLTHYVGLGNIRQNRDENYRVAIRYSAEQAPPCPLLPR